MIYLYVVLKVCLYTICLLLSWFGGILFLVVLIVVELFAPFLFLNNA